MEKNINYSLAAHYIQSEINIYDSIFNFESNLKVATFEKKIPQIGNWTLDLISTPESMTSIIIYK